MQFADMRLAQYMLKFHDVHHCMWHDFKCFVVDMGLVKVMTLVVKNQEETYSVCNTQSGQTKERPRVASTPLQYHNLGPVYTAIEHLPPHTTVVAAAKAPLPVPLQ